MKFIEGIIYCFGFLFPQTQINKDNQNIKIFAGYSYVVRVIKYELSQKSFKKIKNFPNFHFNIYNDLEHIIGNEELEDIIQFLEKNI